MSDDSELVIRLPVSAISTVLAVLSTGRYCDVNDIIVEILRQANSQLCPSAPPAQDVAISESVPAEQSPPGNTLN